VTRSRRERFVGWRRPTALTAGTLAAAGLLSGSQALAANPWQLHCHAMPAEQRTPQPLRTAALSFFPWVRPAATALRSGPVYLVALSSNTRISRDGDSLDESGYYLHRALIAVAPSYPDALTISGHRLGPTGRRTTLQFSTSGATRCTVKSPVVSCGSRPLRFADRLPIAAGKGWRIAKTEIRIGRTGCFAISASGLGLVGRIPLAVPGPDYGTPGW
jgi:hypothetical protein